MGMWSIYKDEYYSIRDAVEKRFPEVIKEDREIELAILQIKALEALIDKKMTERDENDDDN